MDYAEISGISIKSKKNNEIKKEGENTGKENIAAGIDDCCGLVACAPLLQQQQPKFARESQFSSFERGFANFPHLPENDMMPFFLPFTVFYNEAWCSSGDLRLHRAWNVRINLNCSFEWATWIIEEHFGGGFLWTHQISFGFP